MPTIQKLLTQAQEKLAHPDAKLETELLLSEICGIHRTHQLTHPEQPLSDDQLQQFQQALNRRLDGEPLAYILGTRGFWDMDLIVSPDVLIPRPDTECLVEQALFCIPTDSNWQIADLGTGSGAIALAIAGERPQCEITATDLSMAALAIAKENTSKQGVKNIQFVEGSWFQPLTGRHFEMIVSNPPYIRSDDPTLLQNDLSAEPELALVSGNDGLDAIRQIISDSITHLQPEGLLLLEHGFDQSAEVGKLLHDAGFEAIITAKDYGGNERVTAGSLRVTPAA